MNIDLEQVIKESYELGMIQNHSEILDSCKFFQSLNIKSFIEIGTNQGGTFAIWSKLSEDGLRISVDLPGGDFGTNFDLEKRDSYLKSLGSNVHMLHGSSHDKSMLESVQNILNGEKVDFLFIDGDHTFLGVKLDYMMYKDLVKSGGWIAFHDIKDTWFHQSVNCRVDQLWSELEGNKIEFIKPSTGFGGIGFIQNKY